MAVGFPTLPVSPAHSLDEESTSCESTLPTKVSSRKPFYPVHQRTLSLPSPTLVPLHASMKRKFDFVMQPVPEEEHYHMHDDDQAPQDEGSDSSDTESSLSQTMEQAPADLSSQQHELRHPYHNDPSRLAMELKHVKQMHEQDKQFFTKEIRNLRMLLFEAESNLQDRTGELEYILQERESLDKWEWEARREREAADELRETNRALMLELDAKRREYADAMDVLEETQKELLGVVVPIEGHMEQRPSTSSACSGGAAEAGTAGEPNANVSMSNSSPVPSSLGRYASIPTRIASLRKRVLENEERFQAAYSAWSSENKYLRKLHQAQLKTVNDDLRKSREETQAIAAENKKLSTRVGGLKDSLAVSRKESVSARRSRELQIPITPPSMGWPPTQDRISLEEAMKLVQKLNMRIADTALLLVKHLATAGEGSTTSTSPPDSRENPEATREAMWLLGGKVLTSQLTFIPTPSSSKNNLALRTLVQTALTTWSAFHIHSWDLCSSPGEPNAPSSLSSSSLESPLSAIYRKLKVVEDPSVAGKWRSLARAQIRFSSTAWTQTLISSIHNVFSLLGLTYTQLITAMAQELQPLLSSVRSVREALGELVLSKELEVAIVNPGARFDSRCMKDAAFARSLGRKPSTSPPAPPSSSSPSRSPTRRRPEVVVATCTLGLKDGEKLIALPQVIREASLREMVVSMS